MLRENPFVWKLNLIMFSIIFVCIVALRKTTKEDESKENESKSKKQKTSSKKSTKKSK